MVSCDNTVTYTKSERTAVFTKGENSLHKKSFQSTDYLSLNSDSNCIFENTTYSKDENNKEAHVCFSEKGLHTMHLNIQHFMPKFDEILRIFLVSVKLF